MFEACVSQKFDIVRYLLIEKNGDFNVVNKKRVNGTISTIIDWLRYWTFPLDSKEYKVKMEYANPELGHYTSSIFNYF